MKKYMLSVLLIVALLCPGIGSCQSNIAKKKNVMVFNLDSAKRSIERQNAAFQKAFENSDSVGLANLFTVDGKMMMPGSQSIVGRAAIASIAAVFMKMNIKRQARTIDVWGNGDMLIEEGTASLTNQQGQQLDHAKYLVIWKMEDGQWKLFRDMWNTDLSSAK